MKKISSIIAICLVIILSFPSVSCKAIDKQDYCLRMRSTVADAFSDTNYQNWLNWYVWLSDDSVMNNIRTALLDFDVSNFNDYDYYVIGVSYDSQSGSQYNHTLRVWVFNSTLDPYLMYKRSANQTWSVFGDHLNNVGRYYRCSVSNLNYGSWVRDQDLNFNQTYYASNNYGYADFGYGSLLDTNVPAFNVNEYNTVNGGSPSDADYRAFCVDHSWATNLFPSSLEGYDLAGNLVSGDAAPVFESNSNHMYFQNCDFGFCEPKGISSYNQFGGAYIYCRYVVDDWVVNHISDYSLQISMEILLDNQRYFRTLNYPLDRDGCLTLPFKNFGLIGSDNVTQGFVVVGNSNQTIDTDYFKVNLYSITTEQSKQEWFNNAARTYNTVKAIDIYDTYDFSDVQYFYESNVAKYNKFTINLRAVLVSGEDNSGPVARSFNLVTGTDIATDTSGYDNENPFVPDDSSEDYTPSLPSGTNTTVPSIIVNTGGTWQGTFNGVIGYDPGYTDLKVDVNKDPDGNFTQYLNPLKNQTFGSWFFSFLNDMPGEMKALLIAGTGVGIFFGLYRFIRRG